ncbi:unnamed protein product [Sphagnum balticum]
MTVATASEGRTLFDYRTVQWLLVAFLLVFAFVYGKFVMTILRQPVKTSPIALSTNLIPGLNLGCYRDSANRQTSIGSSVSNGLRRRRKRLTDERASEHNADKDIEDTHVEMSGGPSNKINLRKLLSLLGIDRDKEY